MNNGGTMSEVISLNIDTPSIQYLCKKDKRLAKVISMVGSITYQPHEDGYAFLVHEIIEQMLSVKAGAKIYERLSNICNGNISPELIANLSDEDLKSIGTSSSKAMYIKGLTDAVLKGELILSEMTALSDQDVVKKLTSIKGIGDWTAKMYLIFVLDRPDVLPFEDGAFMQSYKWLYHPSDLSKNAIIKKCRKWKPYSSIASRYLYKILDLGMVNEEFHLYK
jgi:DNA-3-methyladenine glycosylase II